MALANENVFAQVDASMASAYFEQVINALNMKDAQAFVAARTLLLLCLGLSSERPR